MIPVKPIVFTMEEPVDDRDEDFQALSESNTKVLFYARQGAQLARAFFAQHGNGKNVEVHLNEPNLAALLAIAFEAGRTS